MDKRTYLASAHVSRFIDWLALELVQREFRLDFVASRFVPGGIRQSIVGAEGALGHFMWRSGWTCPDSGTAVSSDDWASTVATLERLKQGLENAIAACDEGRTFDYCRRILDWGGVSGAVPFLQQKRDTNSLVGYLLDVASLVRLDAPDLDLYAIDDTRIHRFDAGLTKIHSILDDSGSPIYDSRVGAAITMFVALYCDESGIAKPPKLLRFPTGTARGHALRNPGKLGFPKAPGLYTSFSGAAWARSMVRLGWIMEAVVTVSGIFADRSHLRDRLVALQGAFFVLGYDLRAFQIPGIDDVAKPSVVLPAHDLPEGATLLGNAVPTGFCMMKVAQMFGTFLDDGHGLPCNRRGFIDWQVMYGGVGNRNTARANCYPLGAREFDLFEKGLAEQDGFVHGNPAGLVAVLGNRVPAPDERDLVCLMDCYLAGKLADRTPADRVAWLLAREIAGTRSSAETLLGVGRSVGRHFGLIDSDRQPTPAFENFFGQGPWRDYYDL